MLFSGSRLFLFSARLVVNFFFHFLRFSEVALVAFWSVANRALVACFISDGCHLAFINQPCSALVLLRCMTIDTIDATPPS